MTEVYIDPQSKHFLGDRLFSYGYQAPVHALVRSMLEGLGIPVRTIDSLPSKPTSSRKLCFSFGRMRDFQQLACRPDVRLCAFFAFESPIVEPDLYRSLHNVLRYFPRAYCWTDSDSLQPFTNRRLTLHRYHCPQVRGAVAEDLWRRQDRRFLGMINSNKRPPIRFRELYTERLLALHELSTECEVDLYGHEWHLPPYLLGRDKIPYSVRHSYRLMTHLVHKIKPDPLLESARRVWRGVAPDKLSVLSQYRFALCFENMDLKGYVTEKMFDCFFCGTVPIYLGAPDIADYVPRSCFIDRRDFESYTHLAAFLRALSDAEVRRYREAAREFLGSDGFRPFAKETFADRILRMVQEHLESDARLRAPRAADA